MDGMKAATAAAWFAFIVCAAVSPFAIPFLHKLKFGQQIREEGPQGHLKKAGTPTMGGIIFLAAITLACLPFLGSHPRLVPVLLMTLGFGLVGFLDDFLKTVKHQSEGLKVWQKFALQFLVTGAFCAWIMKTQSTAIRIPFLDKELDLGWWYIPFCFFVVIGTDNGTNFTDGLDGLCASVTAVVAAFFAFASLKTGAGIEVIAAAVLGGMLGFLLFNAHPAKVFMGDTGSLALGGFAAAAACMLRQPLLLILVGFIYLIEVLSVILQVGYFKMTHGKRIFRMAPIHHHFELGGWSETRVVTVFTAVTVLLCLLAWLGL